MPAFLFPGQGSQKPGMALDLYERSAVAKSVFEQARALIDPKLLDIMFEGPADDLKDTRNAQPALVLHGIALTEHLRDVGIEPDFCAGHSVGEVGALYAAGSLSLADALAFINRRAELMATQSPPGTMAAVLAMDPDAIEAALPEGAQVANYNGPGQTIISGPVDAIEAAIAALKDAGAKRVLPLPVSGPFHSECMRDAATMLDEHIATMTIHDPKVPFVSSVTGRREDSADAIRDALSKQLCSPVRWTTVMETIGAVEALELGPGNVLQGLAKRTDGAPSVTPVGTHEAVSALTTG